MKAMTFETLVEKIAKERKHLGRRSLNPMKKRCVLHRNDTNQKNNLQRMKIEVEVEVEDKEDSTEEGGDYLIKERNNVIDVEKLVILPVIIELLGIKLLTRKNKYKIKEMIKVTLLNMHIMLLHIVIWEMKKLSVLRFHGMTFGYWILEPHVI